MRSLLKVNVSIQKVLGGLVPVVILILGQLLQRSWQKNAASEEEEKDTTLDTEQDVSQTSLDLNESSVDDEVGAGRSLSQEEAEDLHFYSALIGTCASFEPMKKIIDKRLHREADFLAAHNKLCFRFAAEMRKTFATFFAGTDDIKAALSERCFQSEGLASLVAHSEIASSAVTRIPTMFGPTTIFDPIARDILLAIGKQLFPLYRERVQGFIRSVRSALANSTSEQLNRDVLKRLQHLEPEIISLIQAHPPHCYRYVHSGPLSFKVTQSKYKGGLMNARFRIHSYAAAMTVSSSSTTQDAGKMGSFVLSCDVAGVDPISLLDCRIEEGKYFGRDMEGGVGFTVRGRSAVHPKKRVTFDLVAQSQAEKATWVEKLAMFQKSSANASKMIDFCADATMKIGKYLESKDYDSLKMLTELVAKHLLCAGVGQIRPALVMSFRHVYFKAAGRENWDDEAFREIMGWFKTMVEGRTNEIHEVNRVEEEGKCSLHRHDVKHHHHCVIA
mmetsp:Transcript_10654/g.17151  ORF Transcript_10654/g.17151 Transcript_10654/m.17151 type:complete len:502 (+) Transcript_10654:507-2012(+)